MFENMNPLDRSTALLEIGIIILISFALGFIIGKISLEGSFGKFSFKKKTDEEDEEELNPRDVISEPDGIMATQTRDRDGNALE